MILFNRSKSLIMRFSNININSSAVIILFTVIYLINFMNLFIIIKIELKAIFSSILEDKLIIKFIIISFYKIKRRNNDYNTLFLVSLKLCPFLIGIAFPHYSVEIGCSLNIKNIKIKNSKKT